MEEGSNPLEALVQELAAEAADLPIFDTSDTLPSDTATLLSDDAYATKVAVKKKPARVSAKPDSGYLLSPDMDWILDILKGKEPGTRLRIVRKMRMWDEMGCPDTDEFMPLALKGYSLPDLTNLFFENKCTADSTDLSQGIQNAIKYQEFRELDSGKDHNGLYANALAAPWHSRHSLQDRFRFKTMLCTELQTACDVDDEGEVTLLDSPEIVGDDILELGQRLTSRRLWKNRRADFEDAFANISEERKLTLSCEEQEYLGLASQFIANNSLYREREDLQQIKSKIDDVLSFYLQEPVELSLSDLEVDIFRDFIDNETEVLIPDDYVQLVEESGPELRPAKVFRPIKKSGAPLPPPANLKDTSRYFPGTKILRPAEQLKGAGDPVVNGSVSLESMFQSDAGIHQAYDVLQRSAAENSLMLEKQNVAAAVAKVQGLLLEQRGTESFSAEVLDIVDEDIPFFRDHIREEMEEAKRRRDADFGSVVFDSGTAVKEEVLQESHPDTYKILMSTPSRERVGKTEDTEREVTTGSFDLGVFAKASAETERAFESHADGDLDSMIRYLEAESNIETLVHSLHNYAPNLRFSNVRAGFITGSYDRQKIARMVQIEKKYSEVIFNIDSKRRDAAKKLEDAKGSDVKKYEGIMDSASHIISLINEARDTLFNRFSDLMQSFPPDAPEVASELTHNLRTDMYGVLLRLKQSHKDTELREYFSHLDKHRPDDGIYLKYLVGDIDAAKVKALAQESYAEISKKSVWGRVKGSISSLPSRLIKKDDPTQGPGTADHSASDGPARPLYIPFPVPDPSGQLP
ncbi:MAG: hypothetical protein V1729_00595 [Candidatus Woesearchaeota archaeon]